MEVRNPSFFEAPPFWMVDWTEVNDYLDRVTAGEVWSIGRSHGGRPIRAVAFGERDPIERRATWSSAVAAGHPEDYYDPTKRARPVLILIGSLHGAEMEGTAACVNLAQVIQTGRDLRGKPWPRLAELAAGMRVVMVPVSQPDGRIRSAIRHLVGGTMDDLYYYGQGRMRDGQILRWPECKRMQPVPVEQMDFVGGYYNDAGVNIQHDDFFAPQVAPETRALLDLIRGETPDCFMTLHSCVEAPFIIAPENLISPACQLHQVQIAALCRQRHLQDGLRPRAYTATEPTGGFYLHTALHHTCGGLPLLFEFPQGVVEKPFDLDEILDIGMSLFEEVMAYGAHCRFWPR
ncbi:MAG: hypothetical protein CMJ18_19740 [Phycisphaeraceae bacterium]|nr:hypothetical protein [Phycisphaeraceae bacterium]